MGKIQIADIKIGERRREDLGDIAVLAQNIEKYGLLAPPVLTDDGTLVAGQRRVEAMKLLGWTETPYISKGQLTQAQLHEIELEENIRRKDFTEYEISKNMVALRDLVRERLIEQSEFLSDSDRNSSRGRPKAVDGEKAIADEMGIPRTTIRTAREHVASVQAYPILETLPKYKAVSIAKQADKLPDEQRACFVEMQVENLRNGTARDTDQSTQPTERHAIDEPLSGNVILFPKARMVYDTRDNEPKDQPARDDPLPNNVILFPKEQIANAPQAENPSDAPASDEPLPDNVIPFPGKYGARNLELASTDRFRTATQRSDYEANSQANARAYKLTKAYTNTICAAVQLETSLDAIQEWVRFSRMDEKEVESSLMNVQCAIQKLGVIEKALCDFLKRQL